MESYHKIPSDAVSVHSHDAKVYTHSATASIPREEGHPDLHPESDQLVRIALQTDAENEK